MRVERKAKPKCSTCNGMKMRPQIAVCRVDEGEELKQGFRWTCALELTKNSEPQSSWRASGEEGPG